MNHCPQCNQPVNPNDKFCQSCGYDLRSSPKQKENFYQKNGSVKGKINTEMLNRANQKIQLKNSQMPIAKVAWLLAIMFGFIIILAITEIVAFHPALIMISIFFMLVSIVIGFMFKGRAQKMQSLIDGDSLIAYWQMDKMDKKKYINHLFSAKMMKNTAIFIVTSVLIVIIFGLFVIFMSDGEERLLMALTGLGIILFLSIFAFGFPYFYRWSNQRKDGHVLIGAKYAYVNGYFHNWDYPLSGIQEIKKINDPFDGVLLAYYYTDRTLKHSETIEIPTPSQVDVEALIKSVEAGN